MDRLSGNAGLPPLSRMNRSTFSATSSRRAPGVTSDAARSRALAVSLPAVFHFWRVCSSIRGLLVAIGKGPIGSGHLKVAVAPASANDVEGLERREKLRLVELAAAAHRHRAHREVDDGRGGPRRGQREAHL